MMRLRLYLMRHGETEWTFFGQHTGRADIPLTAPGEDVGREARQRLRNISFGRVLTSPLQHAQQICALAGVGPLPVIEPDLAEWDSGNDEGGTRAEILASRQGSLSILY
jgi:broad specificity phosphatase PhoE